MDYITRRDIARTYGFAPVWSVPLFFERLRSAGPRAIREGGKLVVPRREVEAAFGDLKLTHLLPPLPPDKLIDPAPIEAALEGAGLTPEVLYELIQSFLTDIGAEARAKQKNQDAP
jgi:hypothetical protein